MKGAFHCPYRAYPYTDCLHRQNNVWSYGLITMWLMKCSLPVIYVIWDNLSVAVPCEWGSGHFIGIPLSQGAENLHPLWVSEAQCLTLRVQIGVLGQSGGGWWHSNSSPAEAQWREHPLPTLSAARALRKMDWLATSPKEAMHAVKRLYSTWLLSYAS